MTNTNEMVIALLPTDGDDGRSFVVDDDFMSHVCIEDTPDNRDIVCSIVCAFLNRYEIAKN